MRTKGWIWLVSWVLSAPACGGDTTAGREVVLQTEVQADPEVAGTFVTQTGWTVRLTKAALSVGALYYFDGAPAFAMRSHAGGRVHVAADRYGDGRRSWLEHMLRWPLLSVARAHPGHYAAGAALGQMTTPTTVDLLATPAALPVGNGITGVYRSARFVFAAPRAPGATGLLGESVARLEGSAQKAERTVHFALSASFEDVARSVRQGQVDGCVFAEQEVDGDGTVRLRVVPRVWLDLVDFDDVAPGSPAAPTEIAPGQTPQIAFALGLAQLGAYQFSLRP